MHAYNYIYKLTCLEGLTDDTKEIDCHVVDYAAAAAVADDDDVGDDYDDDADSYEKYTGKIQ